MPAAHFVSRQEIAAIPAMIAPWPPQLHSGVERHDLVPDSDLPIEIVGAIKNFGEAALE